MRTCILVEWLLSRASIVDVLMLASCWLLGNDPTGAKPQAGLPRTVAVAVVMLLTTRTDTSSSLDFSSAALQAH
jgi:hypothetical protein